MDKISKALKKLTNKEKDTIKTILKKIKNNSFTDLDIKKLKGRNDIFRVRKGKIRIIFRKNSENDISILAIERRQDKTYK
jgi:mRNA-degrading endonuclease RelE of RelBE toxin-antitoxin system